MYHPSCMDRIKEVVKLGGYRILCSLKCQMDNKENEDRINNFKEEILKLEGAIVERESHIARLKRNSAVFDDVVYEAEKAFVGQLEQQKKQIEDLQRELEGLRKVETELNLNIEQHKSVQSDLNARIKEQIDLNRNMVVSIEVLERDNKMNSHELNKLKLQLSENRSKSPTIRPGPLTNATENTSQKNKAVTHKNKILIAGPDVMGYLSLMKSLTDRKYDMNSQKIKDVSAVELLELSLPLCKHFTKKDFVFLFLDAKDSQCGKKLCEPVIKEKLVKYQHTNLILIGPSPRIQRPVLNKMIAAQNFVLKNCFRNASNATFLPLISPGPIDKSYLAEYLVYCFIRNDMTSLSPIQYTGRPDHETPALYEPRSKVPEKSSTPNPEYEHEHPIDDNTFLGQARKRKMTVNS